MKNGEKKSTRRTLGYVHGASGSFGRRPFFALRLSEGQVTALDELLNRADRDGRSTITLTASFHQPDRLRVTEYDPPDYEAAAAPEYVRGDVFRVQGREGVSVGLDISSRFGLQLIREQLRSAKSRARQFIVMRVPTRSRAIIEFVPDLELTEQERRALAGDPDKDADSGANGGQAVNAALLGAQIAGLSVEDFSDWEK